MALIQQSVQQLMGNGGAQPAQAGQPPQANGANGNASYQ